LELLKLARLISWGLIAAIVALSIAPVDLRPVTEAPHKIEHLAAFYPAGLALALGYNIKRWLLSLILAAFCAVIEMMQLLVPGRHARLEDFIVDVMAMWAGLITAVLAKSILDRA
jgi:VanZ family protein